MALYFTDREGFGEPVSWQLMCWRGASMPTLRIDILRGHGPRSGIHPITIEPDIHWAAISIHGEDMITPVLARLLMLGVPGTIEEEAWARPAC